MAVKFRNNAKTTLSSGITSSATSIAVADASAWPTLGSGDYSLCTLIDITDLDVVEIVKVTAISGNNLTVVRGHEGTTARAFNAGDRSELRITAGLLEAALTGSDVVKLDSLTASATASYSMAVDGVAYSPSNVNALIVSLNGVTQEPDAAFTISGSTLTFSSALTSADSIDYIVDLAKTLNIGEPSDNTVSPAKLTSAVNLDAITGNGATTTNAVTVGNLTSTGNVEFDGLSGTGAVTVTNILDQDDMSSNSATALATQQSIKAYVDAQVDTADALPEVLANGNTTGGTDISVSSGDDIIFANNSKAKFGSGFHVYNNGSAGFIDNNSSGNIRIRNSVNDADVVIETDDGAGGLDQYLRADGSTGSAILYHYGSEKIKTTSTGIDVTGNVAVTGAGSRRIDISNTSLADTGEMATLQWDGNADLTFQGRSSTGAFKANWYRIEASASDGLADAHRFYTGSSVERMNITSTGIDVTGSITFDGGTTSADLSFGDNDKAIFGAGSDLQIYHDGSNSYINQSGVGNLIIDATTAAMFKTKATFGGSGKKSIVGNNTQISISASTTEWITIARVRAGSTVIEITQNGHSGYNSCRMELSLDFNSSSTTNHAGAQLQKLTVSDGLTELKEVYAKYHSNDSADIIVKVTVGSGGAQNFNFFVENMGEVSDDVAIIGTSTTVDPNLTALTATVKQFAGKVGIGVSPDTILHVKAEDEATIKIESTGAQFPTVFDGTPKVQFVPMSTNGFTGEANIRASAPAALTQATSLVFEVDRSQNQGLNGDYTGGSFSFHDGNKNVAIISESGIDLDGITIGYGPTDGSFLSGPNHVFGANALNSNTAGSGNVAIGGAALYYNTVGRDNIAIGDDALRSNVTGMDNIAIGTDTLRYNNASGNIAIGDHALYNNTSGYGNTALGEYALYYNTTGRYDTAIGDNALYNSTSAWRNTAVGSEALYNSTTGWGNTAVGESSLRNQTTGSYNTVIGSKAGDAVTTGSGNVIIGYVNSSGVNAPLATISTHSNRMMMGHSGITNAYVKVSWTVTSDERDKTGFGPVPHGLDFVKQLTPTKYQFKAGGREGTIGDGIDRYGFLAQDILALEGDNSVIVDSEDADNLKLKENNLIPVLVNAINEQQATIDSLVARLDALES